MYHDLGTKHATMTYMAYNKNPELPRVRREAVYLVKQKGWTVRIAERTAHALSSGNAQEAKPVEATSRLHGKTPCNPSGGSTGS